MFFSPPECHHDNLTPDPYPVPAEASQWCGLEIEAPETPESSFLHAAVDSVPCAQCQTMFG